MEVAPRYTLFLLWTLVLLFKLNCQGKSSKKRTIHGQADFYFQLSINLQYIDLERLVVKRISQKITSKPSQTRPLAKKKEKEENILLAEEKNRETQYWGGRNVYLSINWSSVRDKTFDEVEYFVSWGEKGEDENIL